MTITIQTWVVPLVITICAFAWIFVLEVKNGRDDYRVMFTVPLATIVSLIAWLVWALVS